MVSDILFFIANMMFAQAISTKLILYILVGDSIILALKLLKII